MKRKYKNGNKAEEFLNKHKIISCCLVWIIFYVIAISFALGVTFLTASHSNKSQQTSYSNSAYTQSHSYSSGTSYKASTAKSQDKEEDNNYMYVARTGKKYHRSWCQYVAGKSDTKKISLEEAKESYSPCSKCNPPK